MKKGIFILFFFLLSSCGESLYQEKFKEAQQFKFKSDADSLKKAIDAYEETFLYALQALDEKYEAMKALGIMLAYDKKFVEAIDVLEKVKTVKDTDSEIYYHLGFSYLHLSQNTSNKTEKKLKGEQAKKEFETGLVLDKDNDAFYYGLGLLYGFVFDELEKSLEYLNDAYRLNKQNVNTLFALGNVYYQTGNQNLAKNYYQEIINNFPTNLKAVSQAEKNLKKINEFSINSEQ